MASIDKPPPGSSRGNRRRSGRARDYYTPYLTAGVLLGSGAGAYATLVHKFVKDETALLIAMGAAAVALLAVILTATALMAGFLQDFFGLVIDTATELRRFFLPFRIIARVSAMAAIVSFGGAMNSDTGAGWLRAPLFGLASGMTTWAIFGTVWLISVFVDEAIEQRSMATAKEEAMEKQEELKERETGRKKVAWAPVRGLRM